MANRKGKKRAALGPASASVTNAPVHNSPIIVNQKGKGNHAVKPATRAPSITTAPKVPLPSHFKAAAGHMAKSYGLAILKKVQLFSAQYHDMGDAAKQQIITGLIDIATKSWVHEPGKSPSILSFLMLQNAVLNCRGFQKHSKRQSRMLSSFESLIFRRRKNERRLQLTFQKKNLMLRLLMKLKMTLKRIMLKRIMLKRMMPKRMMLKRMKMLSLLLLYENSSVVEIAERSGSTSG